MLLQIVLGQKHLPPNSVALSLAGIKLLMVNPTGGLSFFSYTLVVPMTLGSAILMWVVSLVTPAPSSATIQRYFVKAV
jgi:hypothetical protein